MPRILVVEDDGDLLYLYGAILTRRGYAVETVKLSADALLHLTNEPFDLIILDIGMPDISGMRIIEFARSDARLKHIPIVVVSANEHNEALTRPWGVRHFFVKPIKLQDIAAVVDGLLQPDRPSFGNER